MEEKVLAYFQQYREHPITRYTATNKYSKKIILSQAELVRFLESYQVDVTGFDYCTWFEGKRRKRQPLKVLHFMEVIRRKKWFDPIPNSASLEEQVYDFFQQHYFDIPVTPNTTINGDINFDECDCPINDALEYFEKEFHVNFDTLKYALYFGELRNNLPPVTVQHMVEVAECKQWFTPTYLEVLTEEEENERWLMGCIENYFMTPITLDTIVNDIPRQEYIEYMLKEYLNVDLTGFDYHTWFVKGSWWRRILLFERKRRPIKVSHLIEVIKRKKWFDPIV